MKPILSSVSLPQFLHARLTEELAAVWGREQERGATTDRPGLAAQVAVLDEQLTLLASGQLPCRRELRILLYAYGTHPDYDPAWTSVAIGVGHQSRPGR